jgi:hypothetical protein
MLLEQLGRCAGSVLTRAGGAKWRQGGLLRPHRRGRVMPLVPRVPISGTATSSNPIKESGPCDGGEH